MDRDDLINILADLRDDTLAVKPNGVVCGSGDDEWLPDQVAEAVAELTADLAKLIAWAKLAPKYQPPPVTTRNEAGKLCDEHGLPL